MNDEIDALRDIAQRLKKEKRTLWKLCMLNARIANLFTDKALRAILGTDYTEFQNNVRLASQMTIEETYVVKAENPEKPTEKKIEGSKVNSGSCSPDIVY